MTHNISTKVDIIMCDMAYEQDVNDCFIGTKYNMINWILPLLNVFKRSCLKVELLFCSYGTLI